MTLLGTGNDIDNSRLIADMNGYNIFEKLGDLKITGNDKRYLDFGLSNTFILTNALEGNSSCITARFDELFEMVDVDNDGILEESAVDIDVKEPKKSRTKFPETWIFSNFKIESNGFVTKKVIVPDTITSFLVSGFAVHPETGFGIAVKQKITVFQNFFLNLYLPYSIRFGEVLNVVVTVFNYNEEAVTIDVEMSNSLTQFKFVSATAEGTTCNIVDSTKKLQKKEIVVQPNSGASTYFLIRPTVTGDITLKVKAYDKDDDGTSDEIEKKFKVEHEGIAKKNNIPMLFDLRNKTSDSYEFEIPISDKHVPSSLKIGVMATGDLIGPALTNIHNLM